MDAISGQGDPSSLLSEPADLHILQMQDTCTTNALDTMTSFFREETFASVCKYGDTFSIYA